MNKDFSYFEILARKTYQVTESSRMGKDNNLHPFDERNIHQDIYEVSLNLFDDAHYAQATFEAYKFLDKKVSSISKLNESGVKLMMQAFNENKPSIRINRLETISHKDEQEGYKFIFSGSMKAIRNPRGHEVDIKDTPQECLDYLSLASMLLRKLDLSSV